MWQGGEAGRSSPEETRTEARGGQDPGRVAGAPGQGGIQLLTHSTEWFHFRTYLHTRDHPSAVWGI